MAINNNEQIIWALKTHQNTPVRTDWLCNLQYYKGFR